jgi:hypothetical protein
MIGHHLPAIMARYIDVRLTLHDVWIVRRLLLMHTKPLNHLQDTFE